MRLLYAHDIDSHGDDEFAQWLREAIPGVTIDSPELPIDPYETLNYLISVADDYDAIIAIGFTAALCQIVGNKIKILINPAMNLPLDIKTQFKDGVIKTTRDSKDVDISIDSAFMQKMYDVGSAIYGVMDLSHKESVYGIFGKNDRVYNHSNDFNHYFMKGFNCPYGYHMYSISSGHTPSRDEIIDEIVPIMRGILWFR